MSEETAVKEQPKVILHAGRTERGEKFRTALKTFDQLPSEVVKEPVKEEPKVEPKPEEKEPEKKAEPPKKSPLDALVKPPEKKTEIKDDDVFESENPNWKRAREVNALRKSRIAQLEAEVEQSKKAPQTDPKIVEQNQALTKQLEEYKAKVEAQERDIKAIDGRYSDEYRGLEKERTQAVKKAVDRFESYAGKGKGDALQEALNLPIGRFRSAQIKEVLADLDGDDRARVLTLIENAEGAEDKLRDFEADLPSKWEEIQQRRDAQVQEKTQQNLKAIQTNFQKVAESLPDKNITLRLVDEKDDDGTWNSDIRSALEEAAKAIQPNGSTFNETAETYIKGKMYDRVEARLIKLYSEYSDAMKRLAEFDGGEVDFKGTRKASEKKLPEKPSERYRQALHALQSGGDME